MLILVQAIGCTETGTRVVLNSLLSSAPVSHFYVVLTTHDTAFSLRQTLSINHNRFRIIGLNRSLFGVLFRVFLELFIAIIAWIRLVSVVNLSHYGLCFGGHYSLYIHSPVLMSPSSNGFAPGSSNFIKRYMLASCIKYASSITVQTNSMYQSLLRFCDRYALPSPLVNVYIPELPPVISESVPIRNYQLQFFYPVSNFSHKRADLAIDAMKIYSKSNFNAGLVITTSGQAKSKSILELGRINHSDVFGYYGGSDILLFTSERETLGLPLLEAMQYGMAIIAPREPYAIDLLGDSGCYFDAFECQSVVRAIHECVSNISFWKEQTLLRTRYLKTASVAWSSHWDSFLAF